MQTLSPAISRTFGHEPISVGVSSRDDAQQLCRAVLAGAPFSARTLVVDLDGGACRLVYASGGEPVAIWDLDLPPAPTASGVVELARRARVHALRGSVDELITVRRRREPGARPIGVLASVVSSALTSELEIPGARVAIDTRR
jgi:hypothetical protein